LDFRNMDFRDQIADGDHYFCWNPVSNGKTGRKVLSWINVVNCVDPIATAFPVAALDLSVSTAEIASGLKDGGIVHRFFGPAKATSVGEAHTEYFNDKEGFLAILLRAAGLAPGLPEHVPSTRSAKDHWIATQSVLHTAQWGLLGLALVAITAYCGIVAYRFNDVRTLWLVPIFAWPALTIGVLAFFQRLMLGGPTKRITTELIRELKLWDGASFPYRVREAVRFLLGRSRDVDPMAPSPGSLVRLTVNAVSLIPALVAMSIPITSTAWLTSDWPTLAGLWTRVWSFEGLLAVASFTVYVICCAAHELIRTWRHVLRILA